MPSALPFQSFIAAMQTACPQNCPRKSATITVVDNLIKRWIIPLVFVGHEVIITNSASYASLVMYHLILQRALMEYLMIIIDSP